MCECNCSDRRIEAKLPAPDGGWYLLRRYPGCRYCDSPAGLDIIHVTNSALGSSTGGVSSLEMATGLKSVGTLPAVPTHELSQGVFEANIAVLSQAGLRHGLVESFGADEVEFGLSGNEYTEAALHTFTEYPIHSDTAPSQPLVGVVLGLVV